MAAGFSRFLGVRMSVRAKFRCTEIQRVARAVPDGQGGWTNGEAQAITLQPVYGQGDPNHENTKFYEATPSGHIQLAMVNLAAAQAFELNREFYVDFTPAPPTVA